MKEIMIIVLTLAGLLLLGAQSAGAQAVPGYTNETASTEYATVLAKPAPSSLPSDNLLNEGGMLRNEWGDGPDPELGTPAVGQSAPTGDGLSVLLVLSLLFVLAKARARN